MPAAAPRIDSRLVAALALLDDTRLPIAEINRRVGSVARRFGLTKPSYEQVRVVVHGLRRRPADPPPAGDMSVDIVFRLGSSRTLLDRLLRRRRQPDARVTVCYLPPARSRKATRASLKPGAA